MLKTEQCRMQRLSCEKWRVAAAAEISFSHMFPAIHVIAHERISKMRQMHSKAET
jgi:hypothetical protein